MFSEQRACNVAAVVSLWLLRLRVARPCEDGRPRFVHGLEYRTVFRLLPNSTELLLLNLFWIIDADDFWSKMIENFNWYFRQTNDEVYGSSLRFDDHRILLYHVIKKYTTCQRLIFVREKVFCQWEGAPGDKRYILLTKATYITKGKDQKGEYSRLGSI